MTIAVVGYFSYGVHNSRLNRALAAD